MQETVIEIRIKGGKMTVSVTGPDIIRLPGDHSDGALPSITINGAQPMDVESPFYKTTAWAEELGEKAYDQIWTEYARKSYQLRQWRYTAACQPNIPEKWVKDMLLYAFVTYGGRATSGVMRLIEQGDTLPVEAGYALKTRCLGKRTLEQLREMKVVL
jgi:hypothetical protein